MPSLDIRSNARKIIRHVNVIIEVNFLIGAAVEIYSIGGKAFTVDIFQGEERIAYAGIHSIDPNDRYLQHHVAQCPITAAPIAVPVGVLIDLYPGGVVSVEHLGRCVVLLCSLLERGHGLCCSDDHGVSAELELGMDEVKGEAAAVGVSARAAMG